MTQPGTYREQAGKNSSEQSAGSRGGTATLNRQGARLPKMGTVEQLEPATVAQLLNAYRQQNLGTLLSVLTQRPAEFARQLGRLCLLQRRPRSWRTPQPGQLRRGAPGSEPSTEP